MKRKNVFKLFTAFVLSSLMVIAIVPAAAFADTDIQETEQPAVVESQFDEGEVSLNDDMIVITSQPRNVSASLSSKVSIQLQAESKDEDALTYQWYYSKNGTKWSKTNVSGSKTSAISMKLKEADNGKMYRCEITDSKGNMVISDAALLTVLSNPVTIAKQPEDAAINIGETATFSLTVSYSGEGSLAYQWYYSSDKGQTWRKTTLTGSRTAELKVKLTRGREGYMYKCVITDGCGNSVSSGTALLQKDNDNGEKWTPVH